MTLCDNAANSLSPPVSPPRLNPAFKCIDFVISCAPLVPYIGSLSPSNGPVAGGMPVQIVMNGLGANQTKQLIKIDGKLVTLTTVKNSTMKGTSPPRYNTTVRAAPQ